MATAEQLLRNRIATAYMKDNLSSIFLTNIFESFAAEQALTSSNSVNSINLNEAAFDDG